MGTRCLWIALVGMGLAGTNAYAAGGHHHRAASQPSAPAPAPEIPPPPPVATPLSIDQAAEVAADTELESDNKALQNLYDAAWAKFQETPDWTAAQYKLTNAQSDVEAAKKAASDALANNPDYQAALAAKQKAVDDLNAAKASGDATPETLSPLATASMLATIKLKTVQDDLFKNDTGVESALSEVVAARQNLGALKTKFQQEILVDKDYAGAKTTVDAAQKKYDDDRGKVASDAGQ